MKYSVSLDSNQLYNLADELQRYAEKYEAKVQIFLERLADLGISVAKQHEGDFAGYIAYSKEFEFGGEKQTVYMLASDSQLIPKAWYVSPKSAEIREESINPLLMAEFGSGHEAIKAEGEAAGLGGQGTLNTYGHAFDADGWYWWSDSSDTETGDEIKAVSKKGRFKHHSRGVPPSRPLHEAVKACLAQVEGIAQEVFG
jgi:hypothetical protein